MIFKTRGIVLHTIDYSDKSVIAKIYTELFGLQSYMINGAKGKNAKIKSRLLQPLSLVEMSVVHKEKNSLHRITEIRSAQPFVSIPYDIIKSSIALFINEILYKSIREEGPNPQLFEFLYSSCHILDLESENCSNFHLFFMLQLSKHLGFYPQEQMQPGLFFDLKEGLFVKNPPSHSFFLSEQLSAALGNLMDSNFASSAVVKLSNAERKELLSKMIIYYELHLSTCKEINSHRILEEVIS